jgi:hypothetical protein
MKTLSFAVAALLLGTIASAAGITGTVTNDTGAPLASMTVVAYRTDGSIGGTATTNASGAYAMTTAAGQYRVLAYDAAGVFATSFYSDAESFETSAVVTVTSTLSASNINLRLVRAGFAAGHVTGSSGNALPNITVAAYNASGTRRGFTTTDASGNVTLVLPPGSYRIAAYDDALNYATTFFSGATSFESAAAVTIAASATATTNFQLPLAAKLTGIVTDRRTLTPVANARVTVYASDGNVAARAATNADGRYAVAVRPGGLRVVVDDPAGKYAATYVPDAESFSMEAIIAAAAGQSITVDATLAVASHLSGHVTDAGTPLAGITAAAYNADGTTRAFAVTDASGAYSIVVPAGDYRIGAFDTALVYLPRFYANQPSFAAAVNVHVATEQTIGGLDFSLTKGARVTGRVTGRSSGAPLSAITIGAYDAGGRLIASANSNATGNYALLLPPSTVKLLAFDSALQFATSYYAGAATFDATQSLPLIEGQSITADFPMSEGGRISGVVIAETAFAPLPNIDIIVYDAAFQTIVQTTTDSGGSFRVVVPPGSYLIAAADPAHRYTSLFYGGGNGSAVNISARQDLGPLQFRLAAAATPLRRRAVKR